MIVLPTGKSYLSELKRLFPIHLAIIAALLFCLSIISDIPGKPLVLHELVMYLTAISVTFSTIYHMVLEYRFMERCLKLSKHCMKWTDSVDYLPSDFALATQRGCIFSVVLVGFYTTISLNHIPTQYLAITVITALNYFNLLAIIVCCVDEEAKLNHIAEKTKVI